MNKNTHFSEILTHLGEERCQYYGAVAPPIIQTSNFAFDTVGEFREAFRDELHSHVYTRGNNPTVEILRAKIAALEHTDDCLALSSGSAAMTAAVMGNIGAGEHIICVEKPYSWTFKLCEVLLKRFGVETTFVDARNMENVYKAIRPNTRLLVLESPNSLSFEIQDLAACAQWAKANDICTVIDNSHCSPYYQNPAEFGIDLVVHSGTKYLNGHSDVICGFICGSKERIAKLFQSELLTIGSIISPHNAWLVLRGLRTFAIRIEKSQENALALCDFLSKRAEVKELIYPLLDSYPQVELARRQMKGAGGLFSVIFHCEDVTKLEKFSNTLAKTFQMAVSWGGYESLHLPCCIFYNDYAPRPVLPISFMRFYAGIEAADYLIAAFEEALPELH